MTSTLIVIAAVLGTALLLVLSGLRLVRDRERAVLFRLGRARHMLRPGVRWVVPLGIDHLVRVDVRTQTITLPPQDAITRDQVLVRVDADVYFQVVDPRLAVTKLENHRETAESLARTTLRAVLGKVVLDDLLGLRAELNGTLAKVLDDELEPWGVRVTGVELRNVVLSEAMQRALTRQAEAEREAQARLSLAQGELAATRALRDAASMVDDNPAVLQLRYLQTLGELGGRSTVVLLPLPVELMQSFVDVRGRVRSHATVAGAAEREKEEAQLGV